MLFASVNELAIIGTTCFMLGCWYLYRAAINHSETVGATVYNVVILGVLVSAIAVVQAYWNGTFGILALLLVLIAGAGHTLVLRAGAHPVSHRAIGITVGSVLVIQTLLWYWPW